MSDSCRVFLDRLDDFAAGRLDAAARRAAEAHLAVCAACRELSTIAAAGAVEPPAGLLTAVLARTSGPACAGARRSLCDRVDGLLKDVDDELVRQHLAHCAACGGLAAALARLAVDLPACATLEPDAAFTRDVLARTSRRPAPVTWRDRAAAAWRTLALRPRIAWEGAYVGAFALAMLFAAPNAPFAGVPERALAAVRSAGTLPAAAANDVPRLRQEAGQRLDEAAGRVRGTTLGWKAAIARSSQEAWTGLKQKAGTLKRGLASLWTKHDDEGRR